MKVESVWAERRVTVTHRCGFHLSPAAIFVECANEFNAEIMVAAVERPDEKWNGKRIIELISLGAAEGTDLLISAKGEDAGAAVDALLHLVQRDFGLAR